ncbi:Cyclin-T1-3 [Hibiscus syriacus]|uniref:Cyclin-T1-3 n=1 Tax=Hibiscus syriacus TaxID=106335 RepID=A0A6A2XHI0_HIBSY|nr:Cyclin-T1-3 [Hibiscus syriacus]
MDLVCAARMCLSAAPHSSTRRWYFSREEIENHSPSRKDGIEVGTEEQLRKLYCSFLQELGMKLKVPQVAIACAMMLCHRFYMRQSHAKNDWQTIATVSTFLACKIEETPRLLQDVLLWAMKLSITRSFCSSIRQRVMLICLGLKHVFSQYHACLMCFIFATQEVYDKQKELILVRRGFCWQQLLLILISNSRTSPLLQLFKNWKFFLTS